MVPWRETPPDDWRSFERIASGVRAQYPHHFMREIHVPSEPTAGYLFYLKQPGDVHRLGDTIVWVHSASGEILFERSARSRTAGESLMHWLYPLHSGTAFGAAGKIAMFITGFAMLLMFPTGLWVWLRKRRARQFEDERCMRRAHAADARDPASSRHGVLG